MDNAITLDRPIFLVGCAKSGTTFLSVLLSFHDAIGPNAPDFPHDTSQTYINALLDENSFNLIAHNIEKKEIWDKYFPIDVPLRVGAEMTIYKNPLSFQKTQQLIKDLTDDFKESRFLGKQPFNTFRIHVLKEIFPDCKIIAIHRDGRDVIASWGTKKGHSWEMFGGYKKAIEIYARKWNECIDHIEYYKNDLDILVVRYEDLVSNMQAELKKIFTHCELEYQSEIYDQLKSSPKTGRWVELIPAQFHELANTLTARNRARLGYNNTSFDFLPNTQLTSEESFTFEDSYSASPKSMHPCPICSSRNFETITFSNRHKINLPTTICMSCGLLMTNPRPPAKWYDSFYKNWFWSIYIGDNHCLEDLYVKDNQDYKGKAIGDYILNNTMREDNIKYLDIGCGLGGLIRYLQSKKPNWEITGIDPSQEAITFLKRKTSDVHLERHSIEKLTLNKKFNIISAVHVLENTLDPTGFLIQIKELLTKDGFLYLEVPDFYSDNWQSKSFLHIAHNYLFDPQTLELLLSSAGFTIKYISKSPVLNDWPWAISLIAQPKHNYEIKSHISVDKELIDYKIHRLQNKTNSSIASHESLFIQLKKALGPGFPGPKTFFRLFKQLKKVKYFN